MAEAVAIRQAGGHRFFDFITHDSAIYDSEFGA